MLLFSITYTPILRKADYQKKSKERKSYREKGEKGERKERRKREVTRGGRNGGREEGKKASIWRSHRSQENPPVHEEF